MVRTPERWTAEVSAKPELVARHVEIPLEILEHPGRPVTLIIPLSKIAGLVKHLSILELRGRSRSTRTGNLYADYGPDLADVDPPDHPS